MLYNFFPHAWYGLPHIKTWSIDRDHIKSASVFMCSVSFSWIFDSYTFIPNLAFSHFERNCSSDSNRSLIHSNYCGYHIDPILSIWHVLDQRNQKT
jgi:hypothetical protein